ncbi:integrase [Anaerosinus sp.]|uniref:integrase n=1 Tax=Selenobaculum sp. TaxID=3074374 RepID=UPI003AB6E964
MESKDILQNKQNSPNSEKTIPDDTFSYDGYQVVRREFFSHVYDPSITFNNCKIWLNTACLKQMPNVNYVQILVNPHDKKLAVRPSNEDEKDSFLWCTTKETTRKPKQITCRLFFAKVIQLMGWNPDYRYKLLGKLIRNNTEHLLIFDLSATETYQRLLNNTEKQKNSRTPVFPAEWQNQFGLPVEEHRRLMQVNIFDGYTVFGLKEQTTEIIADQLVERGGDE